MQEILDELDKKRQAMDHMITNDRYAEAILKCFEGKVGSCPSDEELRRLRTVAKERYDKDIPPGYKDVKAKDMPGAAGDYIGWHQIIEIGKSENANIIFVTGDRKEDWWTTLHGRNLGPRAELIEEFGRLSQRTIYLYDFEGFLRAMKEFHIADVSQDAIEEAREGLHTQNAILQKDQGMTNEALLPKRMAAPHDDDDPRLSKAGIEDEPKMSEIVREQDTSS
jgi:hypothetical protein